MLKMSEARVIDQRRPNRAVKGQTKKHEKKADHSTISISFSMNIRVWSGMGLPPACRRLVALELTLDWFALVMRKSF